MEKENQKLKGNLSAISADLTRKCRVNRSLAEKLEEMERDNSEVSV